MQLMLSLKLKLHLQAFLCAVCFVACIPLVFTSRTIRLEYRQQFQHLLRKLTLVCAERQTPHVEGFSDLQDSHSTSFRCALVIITSPNPCIDQLVEPAVHDCFQALLNICLSNFLASSQADVIFAAESLAPLLSLLETHEANVTDCQVRLDVRSPT